MEKDLRSIKKTTKWNVTKEEINSIINTLGDKLKEKDKYGVKYHNALKEIAIRKIKEEVLEEKNKVIGSYILYGEGAIASNSFFSYSGNFYYNVVLMEDSIKIYALDIKYNLIQKYTFSINELKKVRRSEKNSLNPNDELLLIFKGEYFSLMGIDNNSIENCKRLFNDIQPLVESVKIPLINKLSNFVA